MESEIDKFIKDNKLEENVYKLGVRSDVNKIYSAMDCLVFPSLFEGMPNTLIEAQANGLPCIISNSISPDVKINENLVFLPLDNDYNLWITNILNSKRKTNGVLNAFSSKKYLIEDISNAFLSMIFNGDD